MYEKIRNLSDLCIYRLFTYYTLRVFVVVNTHCERWNTKYIDKIWIRKFLSYLQSFSKFCYCLFSKLVWSFMECFSFYAIKKSIFRTSLEFIILQIFFVKLWTESQRIDKLMRILIKRSITAKRRRRSVFPLIDLFKFLNLNSSYLQKRCLPTRWTITITISTVTFSSLIRKSG